MVSIKKNFVYSSVLTISSYIFPLLTFPYVTRVLGVENIGVYNFVDSVVQNFSIFSMLGIAIVGIREIAKHKNDYKSLSKTFNSLFTLNMLTTLFVVFVFFIFAFISPKLQLYKEMIFIGGAKLLFNALLIEWFYKGLEEFRYITVRSLLVRSIYVVSVFVFVKKPEDYIIYFGLTTLTIVVNAIINILYSQKYIRFSFIGISFKPYIKPLLTLGLYQILTSMYTSFNVMYLGFVTNEIEVGYYTTAVKLYTIILSIFTAFTGVMLPRMSSLIEEKKYEEFRKMSSKSIDILTIFVMPLITICEVFAPYIVHIIAGNGYEGSVLPMRIVMPLMLVIGYEQIIIIQMLFPLKKDNAVLINSVWGCIVGLILNLILVPSLQAVGSSIVWVASELIVLISAQYFVYKFIAYSFPFKILLRELLLMIPILVVDIVIFNSIQYYIYSFIFGICITYFYYFVMVCIIMKNPLINSNLNILLRKLNMGFQLPLIDNFNGI